MQASGPRLRSWTAWGAMAKASAHRCKRDMAWSEDAGRERTKAWMQASDEGNGLGLRSRQSCYKAGKSANIHASSGVIRGIPAKDKITLRNRARVLEAELGGLAGRLRVPAQVRQGVLSLYSRKEFQ
jgi:hypothetical protein